MDLPCSCNESGKNILQTMASLKCDKSAPLDEVFQLHQNIQLLGSGIRKCIGCYANDDVIVALLDGLANLSTLYGTAHTQYSKFSVGKDVVCDTSFQLQSGTDLSQGNSTTSNDETGGRPNGHNIHLIPRTVLSPMPSIVLGRIELTEFESSLIAVTLIKQGLSQTSSHLRDIQQHLIKCLTAKKIQTSKFDAYTRRVGEIMNGIYSSLAGI